MAERTTLNIGSLPGRKSKCLSLTTFHEGGGASIEPLAFFSSEAAYEKFKDALKGRAIFLYEDESAERRNG